MYIQNHNGKKQLKEQLDAKIKSKFWLGIWIKRIDHTYYIHTHNAYRHSANRLKWNKMFGPGMHFASYVCIICVCTVCVCSILIWIQKEYSNKQRPISFPLSVYSLVIIVTTAATSATVTIIIIVSISVAASCLTTGRFNNHPTQ